MGEYVTLLGSENVERAARNMQGAAEEFGRQVGWLTEALQRHQDQMREMLDDHARRIEAATKDESNG